MLQTLRVRNLAIVEDLRVEFAPGLNVVTGETGAGKSILVGALGLVLGNRADRSMIRAGEDRCAVEASFRLADPSAVDAVLDGLGIDACEDGTLLVRRSIAASGGRNFVNDCPTTVQALRTIGDLLVDMHGPHDHQSLLSTAFQLDLLDAFGRLGTHRAAYANEYGEMTALEERLRALSADDRDVARQIDMLDFQVRELEEAKLSPEEETALEQEHRILGNAQRIFELADGIRNALTEDEGSALDGVVAAGKLLGDLARVLDDARAWEKELDSARIQIQELSDTVNTRVQDIEGDPLRLQQVEDRMAVLHRLKRKYGETVSEMLAHLEQSKTRLHDLQTRGEQLAEIEAAISAARQRVRSAGETLSKERARAAKKLARSVTGALRLLGFPHGKFAVSLHPVEPRASGMDGIEFGFAPNIGEPMRPLRAIASSGEISRVMLAVKSILAEHDRIPVLVFDEIDVNVGGEMGHAIGEKLAEVAASHQVLCITHLAQVAARAGTHFVVGKDVAGGRTRTRVARVEDDARVAEVARMLGGGAGSGVSLEHAREMLNGARKKRKKG